MRRRGLRLAVGPMLLVAVVVGGAAPAAHAASPCAGRTWGGPNPIGDVDGDGRSDLIAGTPDRDQGRGGLAVRRSPGKATVQVFSAADLGIADAQPGDRLGAAVATGDVDGDRCS